MSASATLPPGTSDGTAKPHSGDAGTWPGSAVRPTWESWVRGQAEHRRRPECAAHDVARLGTCTGIPVQDPQDFR